MRSSSAIRPRRWAPWLMFLAVSLLLLAAAFITPSPATVSASDLLQNPTPTPTCYTIDWEVQAGPYPYDAYSYGTRGDAKPRLAGVYWGAKVESIWLRDPRTQDMVEVGWYRVNYEDPPNPSTPAFLAVYTIAGVPVNREFEYGPLELPPDVWQHFRVFSNGGNVWRWYLGNELKWTKTLGYTRGYSAGMGERHNSCNAGFARWKALERYKYSPPSNFYWQSWPGMYGTYPYQDTDPYYRLCILANNDFKVRENSVPCDAP